MGSRKESLKKALGITEYPWSSDDELETNSQNNQEVRLNPTESRVSVADMPGTSGVRAPQRLESHIQAPTRQTQSRSENNVTTARGTSPLTQSNMESWRAVNWSRMMNERSNTSASDMRRILAIKRFTRNRLRYCFGRSESGVLPLLTRGNPGVIVPSEATSSQRIRHSPSRRFLQTPTFNPSQTVSSSCPHTVAAFPRRDTLTAAHQASLEINNNPVRSTPHAGLCLDQILEAEEPEEHQDNETEEDGRSRAPMLEEMVAIEIEDSDVPAPPDAAIEDEPRQDQNADDPSAETETDQPPSNEDFMPSSENTAHGAKRKRQDDDNMESDRVQKFNQELLQLLECPVCLEWMEPPMWQCRRGHLVCGGCRARLSACPVCRTTFSSVRNRAMESVSEMLLYPCRHGCGREVRLRMRASHEANCPARRYHCPAPNCAADRPLLLPALANHLQSEHLTMIKIGRRHKFSLKVNTEVRDNWVIFAMQQYFHLRVDVDFRSWGIVLCVLYIGPRCDADNYVYEVEVMGQDNHHKLAYSRYTHGDLISNSLNVSRRSCFNLSLDQAISFIHMKRKNGQADKFLDLTVSLSKVQQIVPREDPDS